MTQGLILKSVLLDFFFFLDNMYLKHWEFLFFLQKKNFIPDFQQYLYIRVVNFSNLKLYELKLFIFWLFRDQTSKSNIYMYSCTKFDFQTFFTYVKKILLYKNLSKAWFYKNVKKNKHFWTSFVVQAVQLGKKRSLCSFKK